MKQFSKELGKVSVTPKGAWDSNITNERLDIVYDKRNNQAYIAKQNVPVGVDIDNREYWQPLNVSGYADNNFINLTTENENGTITAFESIDEAIAAILPINRRAGATLSFYNLNSDRLDRQAEFELWQFNSTDLANWENKNYWNNIYYNWNVFAGWYVSVDSLENHVKIPNVGQYAYVGSNLNDAILYQCRTNGTWTNTGIKVRNYISVVVSGNITIGKNGNWFSDGKDTGIPATPAVDEQLDDIIIQLQQHTTEISNLKKADANLQDQITSNDSDITSLTAKHKSLSKTVQGIAATGGASTATNVTYDNDASGLNAENAQDAIDELASKKFNKENIAQESGEAEDKVMSQKAVNDLSSDILSNVGIFAQNKTINKDTILITKEQVEIGEKFHIEASYVSGNARIEFVGDNENILDRVFIEQTSKTSKDFIIPKNFSYAITRAYFVIESLVSEANNKNLNKNIKNVSNQQVQNSNNLLFNSYSLGTPNISFTQGNIMDDGSLDANNSKRIVSVEIDKPFCIVLKNGWAIKAIYDYTNSQRTSSISLSEYLNTDFHRKKIVLGNDTLGDINPSMLSNSIIDRFYMLDGLRFYRFCNIQNDVNTINKRKIYIDAKAGDKFFYSVDNLTGGTLWINDGNTNIVLENKDTKGLFTFKKDTNLLYLGMTQGKCNVTLLVDNVFANFATTSEVFDCRVRLSALEKNLQKTLDDYIKTLDVTKDKDDYIAWYYNTSCQDIRNMFGNYMNTIKTNKQIETSLMSLKKEGDTLTHDATLCVHPDSKTLFVVTTANNTGVSVDAPDAALTTTRLYIIHLDNISAFSCSDLIIPNQVYTDTNGSTFRTHTEYGTGTPNAYIVGSTLHVLTNILLDNETDWKLCHIRYNIADGSKSYDICNFSIEGNNSYTLSASNINQQLFEGGTLGVRHFMSANSSICYDGRYYYMAIGNHTIWNPAPIFRTTDFTSWEFVTIPNLKIPCDINFEMALGYKEGYFYCAIRQQFESVNGQIRGDKSRTTMILAKIKEGTWEVVESCRIPDDGSRPDFFTYKDDLYLIHSVKGRVIGDFLKIDTYSLNHSVIQQQMSDYCQYPSIKEVIVNKKKLSDSANYGTNGDVKLFLSNNVAIGDVVRYDFTVISGRARIEFCDKNDTVLAVSKYSSNVGDRLVGTLTIPENFSYCITRAQFTLNDLSLIDNKGLFGVSTKNNQLYIYNFNINALDKNTIANKFLEL